MPEPNLDLLSDVELADASSSAIAMRDEAQFLAIETERARRAKTAGHSRSRRELSGDALEAWRTRVNTPRPKLVDPLIFIGSLKHASYKTLDFLYNAPEGAVGSDDRKAIEEEWSRRELLTYKWPYVTMRERHRLRTGFSAALAMASPVLLVALHLMIFRSEATFPRALVSVIVFIVLVGVTGLGVLPVLIGRVYCKLRGRLLSTERPDFRIGKARAIITASIVALLGGAGVLVGLFKDISALLPGLALAGIGLYYLLSGRPAASETSFVLWGRIHGRSKE